MEEKERMLEDWVQAVAAFKPLTYTELPELGLYMDQVITLLNKELLACTVDEERQLTPSMINNYVKDGVLPRPNQKKYSRDHLARLLMICMMKSVLSLPDIDAILQGITTHIPVEALYPDFSDAYDLALREIAGRVEAVADQGEAILYQLAIGLTLEANARRIAVEQILYCLSKEPEKPPAK